MRLQLHDFKVKFILPVSHVSLLIFSLVEKVVAESVVVLKKLLQVNPEDHKDIIIAMSKMANRFVYVWYVCMLCMHACISVCIMYVSCIYTCKYVCMYVCLHV
jgi:hypothetical protein